MRVVRWRKADTGVESFTITATGIYFPVGKVDSAFIARYAMASTGQTATVERVVSADGTRVGTPGITVSGTTEVVSNDRRGLSTGIIVTSISGTLIPVLDNLSPITTWPDESLGRFKAMEDLVAYVYGSTPLVGIKATAGTTECKWNGSAWVAATDAYLGLRGGIVLIGDSHHAYAGVGNPRTSPYASPQATWVSQLQIIKSHSVDIIANLAVGGTRVDQISNTVDAAISLSPSAIFDSSFTNDINQKYDYFTQINIKDAYLRKILANGIAVVLFIAPPFVGMTASQRNMFCKHAQWCYAFAANNKNVYVCDSASICIDPESSSFSPKSSLMLDNYHLNHAGSLAVAKSFASLPDTGQLFPASRYPYMGAYDTPQTNADCVQLFDNPGLLGNISNFGAGVSGAIPTSFYAGRETGSGTAICSLVPFVGGQELAMDFSNCVSGDIFKRQIVPSSSFVDAIRGRSFYVEYVRTFSGCENVCEDYLQLYVDGVINNAGVQYTTGVSSHGLDVSDRSETILLGPFTLSQNATAIRFNFLTIFNGACTGRITMSRLRVISDGRKTIV